MQSSEQLNFSQNPPGPPLTGQGGHNVSPFPSLLGAMPRNIKHLSPFKNVNFQPSETCPRNFIIFDRTDNWSQIMYHPGLSQKSCFLDGLNIGSSPRFLQEKLKTNEVLFSKREISSSFIKEDSHDIEALMSFEEGEYDDEEMSTGRSCNYGSDSDDSCSSKPRKRRKIPTSSNVGGKSYGERKREKMRKMVKALRGIVPGSKNGRMNSVDVLDEAVRYLKSLKVDVQKIGVGNSKK